MRIHALTAVLCATCLTAADPATTAALVIDTSRSSAAPAVADRIRFIAGTLLPMLAPSASSAWTAGRGAEPLDDARALTFATRWSDYAAAVEAAGRALPPGPAAMIIAGDGLVEAVHDGMPAAYLAGLTADATRDQINAKVSERLDGMIASLVRRPGTGWLLLDSGDRPDPASLHAMVRARRPDVGVIPLGSLRLDTLIGGIHAAGLALPGNGRANLAIPPRSTVGEVRIPEGTEAAILILNSPAADGGWSMTTQETAPGWSLATMDGDGPTRAYRIAGCDAGGILRIAIAGTASGIEGVLLHRTRIIHRMTAVPMPGTDFLYAGDPVTIRHEFTRGPGQTRVSEALRATLLKDMTVGGAASRLPEIDRVQLPSAAGSGTLSATVAAPWSAWVESSPLALSWRVASPLVLQGGFQAPTAHDGDPVEIRFHQSGGRRRILATTATLAGPAGLQRMVELRSGSGADAEALVATEVFAETERGVWSFLADAPVAGRNEMGRLSAAAPRGLAVEIVRDWTPYILAGIALLLALITALVWWLMTRPRFRDEVFLGTDGAILLRSRPAARRRDLSLGHPGFSGVVFRALRGRVEIHSIDDGCRVWVNAAPAAVGTVITPGTDVEVRGQRQGHARFFITAAQAAGWGADRALIDAEGGLGQVHVVLDAP